MSTQETTIMKTKNTLLALILSLVVISLKSQTMMVNGRFINTEKQNLKANYTLSCEGKIIDSGKDVDLLSLDLTMNKLYVLTVSKEEFKTKTICFSINPETSKDKYLFEFDVCLKEKYDLQNIKISNTTLIEYNYNCSTNKATSISSEKTNSVNTSTLENNF